MDRHVPQTQLDQVVNQIVDLLDTGSVSKALDMLRSLPFGLIRIDDARVALARFSAAAFDELDIG